MTAEEIESRVRASLAEASKRNVSSLSLDDDLVESLGLDSLQGLQALAVIEKRCGVRFPDEQLAELRTVRKLVTAIQENLERESS